MSGQDFDRSDPVAVIPGDGPPVSSTIANQPIPGTHQSRAFIPILMLATFGVILGLSASIGTGAATLLAQLDPAGKYLGVALISTAAGVMQTIITPLAGRLSDRTRSRLGMRKPWLLWGAIIGLMGTVGVALAPNMLIVMLSVCVAQGGYATVLMAQHALLAEQVPTHRRGLVNGVIGVVTLLAIPVGAMFVAAAPNTPWIWFVGPGMVGTGFSLLLLFAFRDRHLGDVPAPLKLRDALGSFWLSPRRAPDFARAWVGRFLMYLATAPLAVFWLYYLTDRLRLSTEEAVLTMAQAGLVTVVVTAASGIAAGWLSDRLGRRKPLVYICGAAYLLAVVVLLVMPTTLGFWISYGVLTGIATGAFGAVVVALQIDLLPNFVDAGKDLGIVTLSGSLPTIIGPLLATVLLAIGQAPNYTAVIVFAILVLILAVLCVVPIRSVR